jgi:ABC-type phosphate/phosphonate transport system ATPase subunit
MFFGRDEELKRIRDRLRKGDSTAVVGLRRIGKSSLLYQLAHQADQLPQGVVAVYLDLQEAVHHHFAPSGQAVERH